MKKLELNQMENLIGRANVQLKDATKYDAAYEGGGTTRLGCSDALALGGIVLGATAFSPLGWVGFAALMLACDN